MKRVFILLALLLTLGTVFIMLIGKKPQVAQGYDSNEKIKIGVVLVGPKLDGGWNEAHFNGFESASSEMSVEIIYSENVSDVDNSIVAAVDDLAEQGAQIIYATSYGYGDCLGECADKHKQIKFFHAAGVVSGDNIATYFGRIYQARYLSGIVAGMQTKTNEIGFVAAYPIPEVVRGINAFTLGVRSVNPKATVHVKWTYDWKDYDKAADTAGLILDQYPVDILALHHNTTAVIDVAKEHGIYAIGYNLDRLADYPDIFLTASVWDWGSFYKESITASLEGRFEGKAYLGSIADHLVDISPLNPVVSARTAEIMEREKQRMLSDTWDVFYGPIKDQKGNLRVAAGENMSDNELFFTFDWFVEGVEGEIKW